MNFFLMCNTSFAKNSVRLTVILIKRFVFLYLLISLYLEITDEINF